MGKLLRFRSAPVGRGNDDDTWMLDGLNGLAVVIEDLDPVAVEAGLNRTTIQLHTEARLSEFGVAVAPLLEAAESEAVAVLYVAIGAERHLTGLLACHLSIQVCELAALARNPGQGGGVTTWLTNGSWASSPGDLEQDAMEALDEGLGRLGQSLTAARDV